MARHQRSASWPSRSHCLETNLEEKLQKLSASITLFLTLEMIYDCLKAIGDIYSTIKEMLFLPSNQVGLSQPQQMKLVEDELERSLELLDLCSTMQYSFIEMRMSVQDLQLVLQRGDHAAIQGKLQTYDRLARKAKNVFKKISSKCVLPSTVLENCYLAKVHRFLVEARKMTIALLQSILSFLSKQIAAPSSIKWSLISKIFQRGKITFEEEQLQGLESSSGDLESGIEVLLRQLIQSSVSLLNILSS